MSKPEAILFDFDGVLADTEPLHWRCWRDLLAPMGINLEWEWYEANCIGHSERSMLEALIRLAHTPISLNELWSAYPLKKQAFAKAAMREPIIAEELVIDIKTLTNNKLGVVTSSGKTEVEPILERYGLLSRMSACVYGNEVAALKPDPAPYLLALERLGVDCAIVFEDSEVGIASASAAGCQVIRVGHPSEMPQLLRSIAAERR